MCNNKVVCKETNCYVPFEPKKQDARDLKEEIRKTVGQLEVGDNEVLLASYAEGNPKRKYDLENRLFYNIGSGAFSDIFCTYPKEAAFVAASKPNNGQYIYKYKVVSEEEVKEYLEGKTLIVKWQDIPIGPKQGKDDKPDRYYEAIRRETDSIKIMIDDPKPDHILDRAPFGIKIELTVPGSNKRLRPQPASVMKPLLDGVICAFHGEDGEKTKETVKERFLKNGLKDEKIEKFFEASKLNIFGNHNYLTKSNRWNPEDDRLQFGWIIVKREGKEYKMSGSIYKW